LQGDIEKQDIIICNNTNNTIYIYAIYKQPLDYPESIVSRLFEVSKGSVKTTSTIKKFEDLNVCKSYFESHGLVFMPRQHNDDKNIVGSYI